MLSFFLKKLLFCFALCLCFTAYAQTDITIKVRDTYGTGIPDVAIYNTDQFGITDHKGEIRFSNLESGENFTVQHPSYIDQNLSLDSIKANAYTIVLQERTIILDEMVISVTKTSQRSTAVSNKVDVIRPKSIEFLNPQTSADMLQSTGNVFVQKSQAGGGSPIIRGFEANKVLLVVDGVRMNNAIYRSGHLQNVISIDEAMLQRTEVLFGPGSLIYGSDALGGVMHFFTKDAKPSYEDSTWNVFGNASARYSSVNNEKTGHFDVNIGGKKFASLTSWSFSDYDDLKSGRNRNPSFGAWGLVSDYVVRNNGRDTILNNDKPYLQRGTGYTQYDVMQKFVYQANSDLKIKLNLQLSTSSDIPRFDKLRETTAEAVTVSNGTQVFNDTVIQLDSTFNTNRLRFAEWYYGPQLRILAALSFEHERKTRLYDHAHFILSYQFIEESRNERTFQSSMLERNFEKVDVFTFNADFKKKLSVRNYVLFGIESNLNTVQSYGEATNLNTGITSSIQSRYPEEGSFLITNAVYAKHTADIAEKATFSQGVRVNQIYLQSKFSDRKFNGATFNNVLINPVAVSFSFDFTFRPTKEWQINTLFSSGFRAPNVDDIGKIFDPNPQEIVIPNADLKPEYTYNFEAGIARSIGDRIKLEAVGYMTLLSNVITRVPFQLDGQDSISVDGSTELSQVLANTNNGFGYISGLSINLKAAISKHLLIRSTFNYTYGIVADTREPLAHIPPIYGRTSLDYTYKKWQTSIWSQYQGWKRLNTYSSGSVDNLNEATSFGTPAWFTLNWTNSWQLNESFALQFAVENILDSHYRPFGSGVSAGGRNFTVGVRGSF